MSWQWQWRLRQHQAVEQLHWHCPCLAPGRCLRLVGAFTPHQRIPCCYIYAMLNAAPSSKERLYGIRTSLSLLNTPCLESPISCNSHIGHFSSMIRVRAAKLSCLPGKGRDFVSWAKSHGVFPYCNDLAGIVPSGNSTIVRNVYVWSFDDYVTHQ